MSASAASSQAVKPSLTLKRRLNAAPEKVYAAWTNPRHLVKWFGPDSGPVTHGGNRRPRRRRLSDRVPAPRTASSTRSSGVYREVEPNRKLAFTWAWITMPERESFVTILIKPEGEGSILTLIHEQFADEAARDGHEKGWTGALNKLERFVA